MRLRVSVLRLAVVERNGPETVERFPRYPGRIGDPILIRSRVAAGNILLFGHSCIRGLQARVDFLQLRGVVDLEPKAPRIIRAEVPEGSLAAVSIGQSVEIVPEFSQGTTYAGKVIRRAGLFGARKLQSDDPSERADDRVVEVVVSAENAPLLIGQRVMVKFLKPTVATAAATPRAPTVIAAKASPRG